MDVVAPLIADSQASVVVQPREGSLNHPAEDAQPAPMWRSPLRDVWADATRAELLAMWLRVVPAVGVDFVRSMSWTSPLAAYPRNRVHQRYQLRDIIGVRASQDRRKRDSIRICDQMMFAAWLASIRRIRPTFPPHLQPLEWRRCPRSHATSRACPRRATSRAGLHEACPVHRLLASRADGASTSSRSRIPSPVGASPTGCRSSTRRECPSAPFGSRLVSDPSTDTYVASAAEAEARSVPIAGRSTTVSPCGTPSRQECPHGTSAEKRRT